METIIHRRVSVNGVSIHVAEKGDGPVVLLIHGFPELWYTWRHQILSLSTNGYRAVAPDLRGYGDSDSPTDVRSYSILHIVGDLIALIDALGQDKVFVVGHDWGANVAWNLCMMRPDRVRAMVILSVAFRPRHPNRNPVDSLRALYGDDHYICRFQEPGEAEAMFSQMDIGLLTKSFLMYHEPAPLMGSMIKEFGNSHDKQLPPWLSEEDVDYFASKFRESGFTGGLNYYRNLNWNWELTAPWTGTKIMVPVKFIVGDQDLTYNTGGVKDYIHKGGFKRDVPFLQDVVVMEGVGHFINQERPDEISDHIHDFIRKFELGISRNV